jgi:Family of unknown function (DUF5755)
MNLKSPTEIILFGLLIMALTYAFVKGGKQVVIMPPSASASAGQGQQAPIIIQQQSGDDRYTRAPRPQRVWDAPLEIPTRGVLDSIPSRGPPESYQQMGVLTVDDGKVLPLYGRRVAPRSDFFNYYTRTDTYNPVALPIKVGKRDCQDSVGCSEVFNGDHVKMSATGEKAKVTLYGFDGPRYS